MKTANAWPLVLLGNVIQQRKELIEIDDFETYKRCRVQLHAKGIVLRDLVEGYKLKTKKQQVCRTSEFLVAEIDAKVGGFGIVPEELDGAIVSSHYFLFVVDETALDRQFLDYFIRTPDFQKQVSAQGSTNYASIRSQHVLGYEIPLPPLEEQRRIVARIEELATKVEAARALRQQAAEEAEALVGSVSEEILQREAWDMLTIGSTCEVRAGIQKTRARVPRDNPRRYLTVAHVQRNWIDFSDPRYFEVSDTELEKWRLTKGDVLVVEGNGSAHQIGRTALFRGEIEDCVHQNHLIRVRPDQGHIVPEYLNTYLNSPSGQAQMFERSRTTSGLFNLSVGRIKSIEMPLPPLVEQRRIVAYLDALQAKVEAVKQHQAATAAALDALLPSILDRAFKGEL